MPKVSVDFYFPDHLYEGARESVEQTRANLERLSENLARAEMYEIGCELLFDEQEQRLLRACRYHAGAPVPVPGHRLMMLVDKLEKLAVAMRDELKPEQIRNAFEEAAVDVMQETNGNGQLI